MSNTNIETKTIEYLGETLESKWFINDVTTEEIREIQENYYIFDEDKYWKQLKNVIKGGTEKGWIINHINLKHYEKPMGNTRLHHSKWTINEMLNSPELVSYFIARTKSNPKVFNKDLLSNFKTVIRLGGKGVAAKPTKFPIKEATRLLLDYTKHFTKENKPLYFDPTAGWGDRLLTAVKSGFHYYGVDLNNEVVDASSNLISDIYSEELSELYLKVEHGDSTKFQEKFKAKADIILTSPPYFYLEEYNGEKQALKGNNYNNWVQSFVVPFMFNNYQYLKNKRYCLININNFKDYDLVTPFIEAGKNSGFQFLGYDSLKNIKRTNSKSGFNDNSEKVLIFWKE